MDYRGIILICGVLALLACASCAIEYFRRHSSGIDAATLSTCRSRVNAWWLMFGSLICALLLGTGVTVFFFAVISFWALREYVTITPTRPSDHKPLVVVFFLLTPLQFILVGSNPAWFRSVFGRDSYFFFSALIPSCVFLLLPAVVAMTNDTKRYLERIAKLQVGLLICVYSLSFAPALLTMETVKTTGSASACEQQEIPALGIGKQVDKVLTARENPVATFHNSTLEEIASIERSQSDLVTAPEDEDVVADAPIPSDKKEVSQVRSSDEKYASSNVTLLFFFVFLTQVSDVAQYFWSLTFRKHVIAPAVNSSKTYEGLALGALTTVLVAICLRYFTPFGSWIESAFAGLVVACMGFAGNITLSAMKRDQGMGDFEHLIDGHNGVLDRIDSLCFAAPVFYHYVKLCC